MHSPVSPASKVAFPLILENFHLADLYLNHQWVFVSGDLSETEIFPLVKKFPIKMLCFLTPTLYHVHTANFGV